MTLKSVILLVIFSVLATATTALIRILRYNDDPAWPSKKKVKEATDQQIKDWVANLPIARTEKQFLVMDLIARRYIEIEGAATCTIPMDKAKDKILGRKGTPRRDGYEEKLKASIKMLLVAILLSFSSCQLPAPHEYNTAEDVILKQLANEYCLLRVLELKTSGVDYCDLENSDFKLEVFCYHNNPDSIIEQWNFYLTSKKTGYLRLYETSFKVDGFHADHTDERIKAFCDGMRIMANIESIEFPGDTLTKYEVNEYTDLGLAPMLLWDTVTQKWIDSDSLYVLRQQRKANIDQQISDMHNRLSGMQQEISDILNKSHPE